MKDVQYRKPGTAIRSRPDFRSTAYIRKQRYSLPDDSSKEYYVKHVAEAFLPTRYGDFTIVGFYSSRERKEHVAVVKGEVAGKKRCPVRVHSQCFTGDIFHSLKCDCREQLEASLEYIASRPCGVVIYLKQEGRGIGLLNKIKAYHLQDMGLDTVEANEYLGFPGDMRDYTVAAKIISMLRIRSVAILTNNPDKIRGLESQGIDVIERIPVIPKPNTHNAHYLATKTRKMGHLFDM
jgi:GTP cyclohydrolase II